MPYENQCCPKAAKVRLETFLAINKEGFIGPEVEANLLMKSGYVSLYYLIYI